MDFMKERYDLVLERIREISEENAKKDLKKSGEDWAFKQLSDLWLKIDRLYVLTNTGKGVFGKSIEELRTFYDELYANVLPENYETALENPAYAVKRLKRKPGQLLSAIAFNMYDDMLVAATGNLCRLTLEMELFVEIYCIFEEAFSENADKTIAGKEAYERAKKAYYSYYYDNLFDFVEESFDRTYDSKYAFCNRVLAGDVTDERIMYSYGEYVSDNEPQIFDFLKNMSREEVTKMASTLVEGYMRGFVTMQGRFVENGSAAFCYPIGMERMAKEIVRLFGEKKCMVSDRTPALGQRLGRNGGVTVANLNPQFLYDHKNDGALLLDRKYVTRNTEAVKAYCDSHKDVLSNFNGPVLIETFGEEDFDPINKSAAIKFSSVQNRLSVDKKRKANAVMYSCLRSDEMTFSIIAYPVPSIGKDFNPIFADTVKINNLDNKEYRDIQQNIITELDKGYAVHVTGRNGNETDITVALMEITDPEHQTVFENCTADVNIPVGEVFTSPKLKGTNGLLHVKKVFLEGLEFRDLRIRFKDGVTTEITCGNFEKESENKEFISEHLLFRHDFLPLGEFAIGTNTDAYVMAEKYGIQAKMPILIAEKTGPHFAIGDTCYSRAEDHAVYNPNGKEIISRTNDFAELRKTDPAKAYFECHTDITIPYDELGSIVSLRKDGSEFTIIKDGRFAVKGTECLNAVLDGKDR